MTLHTGSTGPPIRANSFEPEVLRQALGALASAGVVNSGDLAVTQNGTPNMSVNVASGFAFVKGTSNSPVQGTYLAYNDAAVNLSVAASDPTNPRNDLVVLAIQDAFYTGATNVPVLSVITGTPAPSPSDPATPVSSITLARLRVNAAATSILTANITDLRVRSYGIGLGPYKARMWQNAAQSIANTTDSVLLQLDTVSYDPSSMCTTGASAKITVTVAGYYLVQGRVGVNTGGVASSNNFSSISVNGSRTTVGQQASADSSTTPGLLVGDVLKLNATDYVQLFVYQSSGGARNTLGGPSVTFLDVHLLSPA